MNDSIRRLSKKLNQRNDLDFAIHEDYIAKPVTTGNLGEYIASKIFDIKLQESGSTKSFDGEFRSGALVDKTVNIKWYTVRRNILALHKDRTPNYYLVLSGPKFAGSSKGVFYPLSIENVYLFKTDDLFDALKVPIGNPTSIKQQLWDDAEIYPNNKSQEIEITDQQIKDLENFKIDDKYKNYLKKIH